MLIISRAKPWTQGGKCPGASYTGNLYETLDHSQQNPPYIVYYYLGDKLVGMRREHHYPVEDPT